MDTLDEKEQSRRTIQWTSAWSSRAKEEARPEDKDVERAPTARGNRRATKEKARARQRKAEARAKEETARAKASLGKAQHQVRAFAAENRAILPGRAGW